MRDKLNITLQRSQALILPMVFVDRHLLLVIDYEWLRSPDYEAVRSSYQIVIVDAVVVVAQYSVKGFGLR